MTTDYNSDSSSDSDSSDSPVTPIRSSHFGGLGDHHSAHPAVILKRTFMDGNIKLYTDSTGASQKTEILVPEGKVVVYKDFEVTPVLSHYKKIDILSLDDDLRGSMDLITRDRTSPLPVYRIFFERSEIGSANGDVAMVVANKLLEGTLHTSSSIGSSIDDEVITTIQNVLHSKR